MTNLIRRTVCLSAVLGAFALMSAPQEAEAGYGRQYYSSWSYYPSRSYYYTTYHYKPAVTYTTYNYHYCVYYPSQPRYVYYYNPVKRVYWGRYDMKEKGYSMLKEEDRKEKLEDIPEKAFPEPGKMPVVPESKDGERITPIDPNTLPEVADKDTSKLP
ncbi:hypothetical protein SH139x_004740 [Planctomycetaceae bacterium SH139]